MRDISFWNGINVNKIINSFFSLHLYSTCGHFTEKKKFKETGYSRYIYQNELDKACFQGDKTYGDFKDLPRRTASAKVLCDKAFHNAKN